MTLRSPKKRPTTAPKSIRETATEHRSANPRRRNRRAVLLVAIGFLWGGIPAQPAQAQYPGNQYQGSHTPSVGSETTWNGHLGYRPVPKVRSAEISPSTASTPNGNDPRRPGWNLQWRTSPQIAAEQARQISDAAFEQPAFAESHPNPTNAPRIIATAANDRVNAPGHTATSHAATGSAATGHAVLPANSLRPQNAHEVQPVAWMAPQPPAPQTPPSGGGFSLPGNTFRDGTVQPPAAAEMVPPGSAFQIPQSGVPAELPSPSRSSFGLPLGAPESAGPSTSSELRELFETPRELNQPGVPRSPSNGEIPSEPAPSIRDMLQDAPEPLVTPQPNAVEEIDEAEDSPSDRDTFEPNPFGNRDQQAEPMNDENMARDRRDRERLERGDSPSIFESDNEGPTNSGTGLSCEDFRERIREATIDQVSLDLSPPFRPDVIEDADFEKLKGKFSENQKTRTWRSIDGRPLGTGRLEDLAYEKAIITTEFGTREELPLNRLSEPDLAYISQNWGLPTECLIEQVAYTPRAWTPTTMTYAASNLCHKPLYFEEVNLERYGHTAGPLAQPIISSAHFFLNIAVLPYKMGVHSPHECQYALGYYRPGNCAPWIIPPVPLSVRGAWYQAAAMTGTALLIP